MAGGIIALTFPWRQHNYLGELANATGNDIEVGAWLVLVDWVVSDGMWYYDTTNHRFRIRSGGDWIWQEGGSPPAQVVTVAKAGAQFTSIRDAYDSITDNATGKRYVVMVYPGDYNENNPLPEKDYVSMVFVSRHEATRMICNNVDQHGLLCGKDTDYVGVQIQGASNAGKAGFYIAPTNEDVDFHDCKVRNCNIGILNESGATGEGIMVREFMVTGGTIDTVIKSVANSETHVLGLFMADDVTVTNAIVADGANSMVNVFASELDGTAFVNGLYALNGGTIHPNGVFIKNATNSLRTNNGIIKGSAVDIVNSGSYDILTGNVVDEVEVVSSHIDVSKISQTPGSVIEFNIKSFTDNVVNMPDSDVWMLGYYSEELTGVTVDGGPTTQDIDDMNRYFVNVEILAEAASGTLRITGTSYDPTDGSTSIGDTEDIVINGTGWYISTKRWIDTVTLSSVAGLDVTLDGYREGGWSNEGVGFYLLAGLAEYESKVGINSVRLLITKFDTTNGYQTMIDFTDPNVSQSIQTIYPRNQLDEPFDVSNGDRFYFWVDVNKIAKMKWSMTYDQER